MPTHMSPTSWGLYKCYTPKHQANGTEPKTLKHRLPIPFPSLDSTIVSQAKVKDDPSWFSWGLALAGDAWETLSTFFVDLFCFITSFFWEEQYDLSPFKKLLEQPALCLKPNGDNSKLLWESFGLFESSANSFDRQGFDRRGWLEGKMVNNLTTQFPPATSPVLRFVSLKPSGLLQELILVGQLLEKGYKKIEIAFKGATANDELTLKFKGLLSQFAKEKGARVLFFETVAPDVNIHAACAIGLENFAAHALELVALHNRLEKNGYLYIGIDSATYVINPNRLDVMKSSGLDLLRADMCHLKVGWDFDDTKGGHYLVLNPLNFFELDFALLTKLAEKTDKKIHVIVLGLEGHKEIKEWLKLLSPQYEEVFTIEFIESLDMCKEKVDFITAFSCLDYPEETEELEKMLKPWGSLYIADATLGIKRRSEKRGEKVLTT